MTKIREPLPGEILGHNYILEKEIGRGGFGVVFKARHLDIDRSVAIKVLLATYGMKDPRAKDRFKREATITASLEYPNSIRIFDYGETDEGVFYIVMEFVHGKDLGQVLEVEGRLSVPRAIHIVRQVLHALMEAHARGIVHRDIKPDNVMLVAIAYDTDHVKVMDFGIAKMVDSGAEITQHGITLGTPRYMPIEQLKGQHLGPASDLYAVGLLLYEMLVGRPAFSGETAVDTAVAVMEGGSVEVPEDAPVPAPLRKIIAKACARHAEDRYQSARAFLEAINELDPSLLDVDGAEKERFPDKAPTLESVDPDASRSVVASRRALSDEDDVAASTQAISTDDVLAAAPPTCCDASFCRAVAGPARGAHRRARDPSARCSRGDLARRTRAGDRPGPSTWGARGDGARQLRLGGASGEVARQQPGDSRALGHELGHPGRRGDHPHPFALTIIAGGSLQARLMGARQATQVYEVRPWSIRRSWRRFPREARS